MKRKKSMIMDSVIPNYSKICGDCKNLLGFRRCEAFPVIESIPLEIWLGDHDHKTPFPGDKGIMFEYRFEGIATEKERAEAIDYIKRFGVKMNDMAKDARQYYRLTESDFE